MRGRGRAGSGLGGGYWEAEESQDVCGASSRGRRLMGPGSRTGFYRVIGCLCRIGISKVSS